MTAAQRTEAEEKVFAHLRRHSAFQEARTVLLFHSLPDEVNTRPFVAECTAEKTVLLPVVSGPDLLVKRYVSDAALCEGAFHIAEPVGREFTAWQDIDLVIVPGVAFTAQGARLGRGKGYYDRLLAHPAFARTYKIGVCYPCQLLQELPVEAHDVRMDEVITE